jgi:TrmH RNA methyltransferase
MGVSIILEGERKDFRAPDTDPHPLMAPRKPRRADHRQPEKESRIAGFAAVAALFDRNPDRIKRLFIDERVKAEARDFTQYMSQARKPWRAVPADELARIAGTPMHGGIVAAAHEKEVKVFNPAEAKVWAKDGAPLLLLDGVGNPHNLGAIARTAAFFGMPRIVLSSHPEQAGLSDATYRIAEGGIEYIDFYKAPDFPAALKRLNESFHVIGTALGDYTPLNALKRPAGKPLAIVMGNEEDGLPEASLRACGELVTIPGSGAVQSLNVSATTAILIYAAKFGQ